MPHQLRRIERKSDRRVILGETEEGVSKIIAVDIADIVVNDIGDV